MTPTPEPVTEDGLELDRLIAAFEPVLHEYSLSVCRGTEFDLPKQLAIAALNTEPARSGELAELLELAGDYAADVFNSFPDKTSPCALEVERNLGRFNAALAALSKTNNEVRG